MVLSFVKAFLISLYSWFAVAEQPVFKSRNQTLEQFLEANMAYPSYAKQNCIQGSIKIGFQLNKNGELANLQVKNGIGVDLDDEALRLISLTNGKWTIPKGYLENTEIIIPVKFSLKNYNCESYAKRTIEKAIMAYQTRQALENTVTNYYQNRIVGKVNTENEQQITRLKVDLGFDKELVAEKMAEAKEMLKQGNTKEACKALNFIKNIGFNDADDMIAENCK